jgi:hypothetical protein
VIAFSQPMTMFVLHTWIDSVDGHIQFISLAAAPILLVPPCDVL